MSPTTLDLNLLRTLAQLLEKRSVTGAARALGVGQPAISKQLERLRSALGDPLLVRSGSTMQLTPRATLLMVKVRDAMQAIDALTERPRPFEPAAASGAFRIACGDEALPVVLGPFLRRLFDAAPRVDVRIRPLGRQFAAQLDGGQVDVALVPDLRHVTGLGFPDLDRFVLKACGSERFVVVSRARRRWTLDQYLAARHVAVTPLGESDVSLLDRELERQGRSRRIALTVPSFTAAVQAVARSELVATLPEGIVDFVAPELHRVRSPVTFPFDEVETVMVWHPRNTTDERHRFLREQLLESVSQRSPARTPALARAPGASRGPVTPSGR